MSVDQIRPALDSIDATPRDGFLGELEDQLVAAWTDAVDDTDYLAALSTRSTTVTLIDAEPTPTPTEGRHRWPIVAVAAAAVVALVVGALILAARDDSGTQVPADTTVNNNTTTVAPDAGTAAAGIARGFLDAYAANDADRALSYLTDDAIAAGPAIPARGRRAWESAEEFRRTLAWNVAAGYKLTINGCERSDGGTDTDITVRCDYDVHALGSDALGLGPFPGDPGWDLTVRGDKIVANSNDESPGGLFEGVWRPFGRWIRTEHPDDVPIMYRDTSQNLNTQATTDEALRLWEQRAAEFVQAVLTGREAFPADLAAVCATQAERLGELAVPAEGALDQVATWNTAAAAILQQTRDELDALDKPPLMDTAAYSNYYGNLIRVVRNFEARAEAATAGDSPRLAELDAEYLDLRQGMSSGPAVSGLEECLATLPS